VRWSLKGKSLVAKVLLRKNNVLYINYGGCGVLFDAFHFKFRYPTRAYSLGSQKSFSGDAQEFAFYGATCDSIDFMKGPFVLPSNIEEGDYVEIGTLGGYGSAMRSQFNGFYAEKVARIV
jgi:ornithine decarboxylase